MNIGMAPWLLWSIVCAYSVRWAIVQLLNRRLSRLSYLAAYATWVLLFAVGAIIVWATGFDFKGPPGSARGVQFIGYLVCVWSPLGVPIILGAGPVIIWDAFRALVKSPIASRSRSKPT